MYSWLAEYVEAFYTLSSQRMFNDVSPQPIQIRDIQAYIQMFGTPEGVKSFVTYLLAMDKVHLELVCKQQSMNLENSESLNDRTQD